MSKVLYAILVCLISLRVECANILGVFMIPSFSHQVIYQPIWRELSLRGHRVTVVTPDPLKDPSLVNLTELDMSFAYETRRRHNMQNSINKNLPITHVIKNVYNMLGELAEIELKHSAVQELIKDKNRKFDVMLVEFLHPLMYALSARFGCPMIGVTSLDSTLPGHDAVGNPSHPVLNPDLFLPNTEDLGFYERVHSTLYSIWFRYYYRSHVLPSLDKVARKYVMEDMPYLGDIEKNVSMLFINVNPLLQKIRPNVPAVVELGQMQIREKKPLPKDLQDELDSATKGAIYFSLGSNVRSSNLSQEMREKLVGALSEIPYKVFWKWEEDQLPGQPKNVIARKWFPQQDILGHKNIKVFLTHGGLQSMEEAIAYAVPCVGMPFFADQPMNVKKMVNLGIAVGVDPEKVTKEELKAALIEVAENPNYLNKVRETRDLIRDVPMTGLEKAVWWTEYVIRHKGARHLRSPGVDLSLWQYFLLDVFAFLLGVVLLALFVLYKFVGLILKAIKLLFRKDKVKDE